MACPSCLPARTGRIAILGLLVLVAVSLAFQSDAIRTERKPGGDAQLVSAQPLPEMDGALCEWAPASASVALRASLQEGGSARTGVPSESGRAAAAGRSPIRTLGDVYSVFSAVAVDAVRNEVVMT